MRLNEIKKKRLNTPEQRGVEIQIRLKIRFLGVLLIHCQYFYSTII